MQIMTAILDITQPSTGFWQHCMLAAGVSYLTQFWQPIECCLLNGVLAANRVLPTQRNSDSIGCYSTVNAILAANWMLPT